MPKYLPKIKNNLSKKSDRVSIGQAAEILNVSIDTIRRWDKEGKVFSTRPDGKNRYFSIKDLEAIKFSKPLSISQAAEALGISQTTLRRLDKKGLIKPKRNDSGERLYDKDSIDKFLKSQYFLHQKQVEDKVLEPFKKNEPKEVPNETTHKVLTSIAVQNKFDVDKLNSFKKAFYVAGLSISISFILLITALTVLDLIFPAEMSKLLSYRGANQNNFLSKTTDPNQPAVLGATYAPTQQPRTSLLGSVLKPFNTIPLNIVKQVNPDIYDQIVQSQPIEDINDVFYIDNNGHVSPGITLALPDSSYLEVPDKGLIQNLNADYLRGKVPGGNSGDLVVYDQDGTIKNLKITSTNLKNGLITAQFIAPQAVTDQALSKNSVGSANLKDGSVTSSKIGDGEVKEVNIGNGAVTTAKVADGAIGTSQLANSAVTSDQIADGTITNTDISDSADISDSKLAQITSTDKVAGSAVQLAPGGGLTNNSGLSLLTTCTNNQVLRWNVAQSAWICATVSSGGGGTAGVSTLNGFDGDLTLTGAGIASISDNGVDTITVTATEADTLNSVAGRGATTSTTLALNGGFTSSSSTPIQLSSTSPAISIGNTGTLSITDGSNTLLSLADSGTTGNLSVSGTINGLTISSGTITGATIAAGSNTISGLTNSNLSGSAGITNANLANSSVTINTAGPLGGGGAVSLGGTLNLTCSTCLTAEADTLATVTARGASTSTGLTLSSASSLTLSSSAPVVTIGAADANGALTIKDSAGSPNTLLTLTDSGTSGVLGVSTISASNIGAFTLTGNITGSGTPNLSGIGTISSGAITAPTSSNTINGLVINSGALSAVTGFAQASGNFDQSGSSGTFSTGTGTNTLNGNTIIASTKTFRIVGGAGDPTATSGIVWYDTTTNKFKVVENGTVKTLCNTTDNGCGTGGGGAVDSVSNSDGTLTIDPTTGAVVASLNLANANTWSALQAFSGGAFASEPDNTSSSYALYLQRNTDTSPDGYLIQAQNAAGDSNLFTVGASGAITTAAGITAATTGTINGISINSGTITGATIAAGSNTISGLTNANLSGSAGITDANISDTLTIGAGSSVAAAALTGTIASGRISGSYTGLTGTGTLTAGSTGTGFTIDFGSSTLTGDVTGANISGVDISSDTNLSASDGITLTGDALTNSDKGSSQNIFKTIAISGQSNVVTDVNADTLTFVAGSNVTLTTDASTDAITIAATDTNTTYSAGTDLDLTGTTFSLETTLDSVDTINLAGTGTLNGLDVLDNTSETTIENAIDTLANLTSASSLTTVGTLTGGATGAGFTIDFDASTLSGIVPVVNGGTGVDTFGGTNTLLFTTATDTLSSISAGTNGQILVGKTADAPLFATLSGDATIANTGALTLKNTGTAGTYGSATQVPVFTTDAQGRVTAVTNTNLTVSGSNCATCLLTTGGQTVAKSGGNGTTGDTFNVTNTAATGTAAANGLVIGLTGTDTDGANTNNGLNFSAVATHTGNTFNALFFPASNNYDYFLNSPTITIAGNGTIAGATIAAGSNTISGLTNANLSGSAGITDANISDTLTIGAGSSVAAAALTGTIASGRISGSYTDLTGTGTLTAGSTGTGFTLDFGSSTLTGDVTGANISGIDISNDTNLSASDGITLTGDALTNSDKGSSQNIFKTIAISGQSNVVTDANADTLTFVAGSNVTLTTDATTDTITIAGTDTNTTYSAGTDLDLTGTTFSLETTLDSVDTINLAGTGTLNGLDAIDGTSETTLEAALDIAGEVTGTGLGSVTINSNVIDDAELVDALTYTGALSVSNLTISDTNVPLTGASFAFAFNNAADRTFTITNSDGTGVANLAVEGTVVASNLSGTNTGDQTAGTDLDLSGGAFSLETTLDSVDTINLAGTGTLNGLDAIDSTTETTIESAIDTLANLTSASSLVTVGTLTGGATGAGFTLNFGTSTLSGNVPLNHGGTNATTSQGAIDNISQLTTEGDLLYHNGTNSTRLPRGADTECLKSNATTIVWGSCGGSASQTPWTSDIDADNFSLLDFGSNLTSRGASTFGSANNGGGASGLITLNSGTGTTSTGGVTLVTGNASAGTAGDISLDVGTSTSSNGSIKIGTAGRAQTITIGNSTGGTITVGASSGSNLVLNDADWSVTGAGAASFASVTEGGTALASKYAPINANFITVTSNATLTGETGIDNLSTAILTSSTLGSGTTTITSANASAFAVGRQGATSPAFVIDASAGTSVTGLKLTAGAAGGGISEAVIGGNAAENYSLDAKGAGTITLGGTSTGNLNLGTATTSKTIQLGATATATDTINFLRSGAGTIKFANFNTANQMLYVSGTDGAVSALAPNSGATQCLTQASSGTPAWGSCGSGGAQTPWTSDIDADNFSLLDFGPNLTSRAATTIGSANNGAGASGLLTLNSGTGTTSTGGVTLVTGNASAGTAGNISVDVGTSSSGNGAINIGTASRAQSVTVGNITGASSLALKAGSAGVSITNATTTVTTFGSSTANSDTIQIKPQSGTATNTFNGIITTADLTASDKTWTFPDASGTVAVSATGPIGLSAAGAISCSTCVTSATTLFTLTGTDSGVNQALVSGDTLTIAAGTGIDTTPSNTDTLTVAFDSTEIGSTTWGSGAGITWTYDASAGTDPSLTFSDTQVQIGGSAPKASATTAVALLGATTLSGGNANGTYLGANAASNYAGDFFTLQQNNNNVYRITSAASAVNGVQYTLAATGSAPTLAALGSDTDIGLNISAKGAGTIALSSAATTGSGTTSAITGIDNSLTSGTLLYLASTSITSGNFLDINNGSSVFSISNTSVTTSLPFNETAPGDLSVAYDINLTNPTISYIKSAAPLVLQAGETFNSSNLNLTTFNQGSVVFDESGNTTGTAVDMTNFGTTTGTGLNLQGNSVTSGTVFNVSSSATAETGALVLITQSGSATTNTGNVLEIDNTGQTSASKAFYIKHYATATNNLAMRVDDITGDTSPFIIDGSGNVGIGLTTATYKLDVRDSQSANYVMRIMNTALNNNQKGLIIDLGVVNSSRTTGTRFIDFANSGNVAGKIQGSTSGLSQVVYTTNGADYAEYFRDADVNNQAEAGQALTFGDQSRSTKVSGKANDQNVLGIVSSGAGFVGNGPICHVGDDNCDYSYGQDNTLVALSGQVPLKVSDENGPIEIGDFLTTSSTPGVAMKATQAGQMIARALDNYNSEGVGTITVLVYNGFADPLNQLANLTSAGLTTQYLTQDQLPQIVQQAAVDAAKISGGVTVEQFNSLSDRVKSLEEILSSKTPVGTSEASNSANLVAQAPVVASNLFEAVASSSAHLNKINSDINDLLGSMNIDSSSSANLAAFEATSSGGLVVDSINVTGTATVSGQLQVKGGGLFDGIAKLVSGIAEFIGSSIFKGDTLFVGRATFNSDTTGQAVIYQGQDNVQVTFNKEYKNPANINVSINIDQVEKSAGESDAVFSARLKAQQAAENSILAGNLKYIVTNRSKTGFTIKLNAKAPVDIKFSWTALANNDQADLQNFEAQINPEATMSALPSPTTTPVPTPTPTPPPTPTPKKQVTISKNELGFLRVRQEPDINAAELGQVEPGQTFSVVKESDPQTTGGKIWYQIEFQTGQFGWVSGAYVAVEKNL